MTIEIRTANLSDVDDIARLWRHLHELHVGQLSWYFRSATDDQLRALTTEALNNADTRSVVARFEGGFAGYAIGSVRIRPERALASEYRALYLDQMVVERHLRRHGVGRALMSSFIEQARQEGLARVDLDTWDFNDEGRAFFASLGFASQVQRLSLDVEPHNPPSLADGASPAAERQYR